jgi:hypothetical protein
MRRAAVSLGRRGTVRALLALAPLVVAAAVFLVTEAVGANAQSVTGKAVPDEYRAAVIAAGTACTTLSAERVAAQIMTESAFAPTATNGRGGRGLAGLTVDQWDTWKPWSTATRTDGPANILALAHLTCDTVGQLRVAGVPGDQWRLALAGLYSGTQAVVTAKGVPAAARDHVDLVAGYATYYEQNGGLTYASPTASPATARRAGASASAGPPVSPSRSPDTGPPSAAPPRTPPADAPAPPSSRRPSPAPAGPLTVGQFWNEEAHGCLDSGAAQNGTDLAVKACDGSARQRWQLMPNGTIHSQGLCMDLDGANPAPFTVVQVANCSGNPAQLWHYDGQSHIYDSYANECVNIDWQGDGPHVLAYSCLGQPNQTYVLQRQ